MDDVVKSFSDGIAWDGYFDGFMKEKEHDFYVLGNRNGIKGAGVILYEGLFKEMAKTTSLFGEDEDGSTSQMVDYFMDNTIAELASQSTEQNSLGLAQTLYEQMKRNYGL